MAAKKNKVAIRTVVDPEKLSKKARRAYYDQARNRLERDYGFAGCPCTRAIPSAKGYDRTRSKRETRAAMAW